MNEKQIETLILRWINFQSGCFAFKINTVGVFDSEKQIYRKNRNRFLMKGTSDILGIAYGQFIAIEIKTPKTIKSFEKQKTETVRNQKAFLDQVTSHGGCSLVASSLEDVISFIESIKKRSMFHVEH